MRDIMAREILNTRTALALMSAMSNSFEHENLSHAGMAKYRKNRVTRMIANWMMETDGENVSSSFGMAQSFLGERFLGLNNNNFGISDGWNIEEFERRLPPPDVLCELTHEGWYLVRSPAHADLRRVRDRLERYNFFSEKLPEYFTNSKDFTQPGWLAFKIFKEGARDSYFDECPPPNIAELVWGFGITALCDQRILFETTTLVDVAEELYPDAPSLSYISFNGKLHFTEKESPYFCRVRRFV